MDTLKTFLRRSITAVGLTVALNENFPLYFSVRTAEYTIAIIFPTLKKYETPIIILITLFFAQTGDLCAALV